MGSVIYRDRDRERDRFDDSRTTISSSRRGDDRGGYTTVKRYVVKGEDDSRSSFGGGSRVRPVERVEETRMVRREVDVDEPPRRYERRDDPRSSERELVIRRDRVEEDSRRDNGRRDDRTDERELVIRRTTEREEPSRERELTVSRYDDRRDDRYDLDIRRGDYGDRDLQRYNRTTEYFQPAPQPQTIVIRNEIVMPRGRDDDFDVVRRSEADDERSVVRREPSRGRDEEFFYEKKVRERIDEPPRDDYDDRRPRREISPHDSVSQVGRRDRGYSSDDSMVYVRNKVTEDEGYDGSRSPKHRRHLAEGVIAGIGAAELLRHHNRQEGRETSGGIGRIGRDVGAGALGALAAEGVTRARSKIRERSKSRRRSRSDSRGRGGRSRSRSRSRAGSRGRDRSRSRSESGSRNKKLAGLGLGAAAIAAAAVYAQKKHNKDKSQSPDGRGRSSSRRRASSLPPSEADDSRNPSRRNKRMAEAGAAGAVLAALVDRQRSKSKGGRDRSQSRARQAIPIIAAGLGSAGLAAFYEKNKAKKDSEEAARIERRASRSRSRSRSRGRGRSADPYYDGPRGAAMSDPNLIEYGEGNVYGNNYGADYYGQPPPGDAYYNNHQNAVVPAVAGAGAYDASRDVRPSRSRSLSSQSDSDDVGRRRRRRRRDRASRSRSAGKEAAAAVGGVAAATEYERHKQEKRDRRARRRQEQQGGYAQDPYEDQYDPQQQQYVPTPPPAHDPYAAQTGFFSQSGHFPPPPGAAPPQFQTQQPAAAYAPGTAYNPNDFPPPPGAAPAQYNSTFASGGNADPYAPRGRGADENVSAAPAFGDPLPNQTQSVPDGLNTHPSVSPSAPTPLINIERPSGSSNPNPQRSNPFLPVPDPFGYSAAPPHPSYPTSSPRSTSQPPGHRKSVAFADASGFTGNTSSTTIASSQQSGHHRHVDANRGYEAGDDTDSTLAAPRTNRDTARSQTQPATAANAASTAAASSLNPRNGKERHHARRRSADPRTSSAARSAPVDPSASTSQGVPVPAVSPAPSDETIDLPDRFDKYGRKKPEPGEDPVADRLDDILAGKGTTGKLFGNFVNGLFGPEGRKKGGGGGGRRSR